MVKICTFPLSSFIICLLAFCTQCRNVSLTPLSIPIQAEAQVVPAAESLANAERAAAELKSIASADASAQVQQAAGKKKGKKGSKVRLRLSRSYPCSISVL